MSASRPAPRRLPNGALRRLVASQLAMCPDPLTAVEIAKTLIRSHGAVVNALEHLTRTGHARKTTNAKGKPAYQATASTATAAAAVSVPTPRPAPAPRPAAPPPPPAAPPRPAGPAPGDALPGGGILRPTGGVYQPRSLAGTTDVEALRKLRKAGVFVLLYGPPGTGKTSLVEAAHPDLITVAGDGDTTAGDLVGEYTQAPGGKGYVFVYGPLVRAMQEGRALFVDDATLIPPSVLAVLYPAMDGRGQIQVKAHTGETITAKPGFYVIAGHNPGVHGAVLTDALASRFTVQIEVRTDYTLATKLGIDRKAVQLAEALDTLQNAGKIDWVPQLRELLGYQATANALGEQVAVANLLGAAPPDDRAVVADAIQKIYGRAFTPLALGRQIRPAT